MTFTQEAARALQELLLRAWCRDTSASGEAWSADNPALGQCAVTALVVQDLFGGKLGRTRVSGESHYLNVFPGDPPLYLDATLEQFDAFCGYDEAIGIRDREYVLSFAGTALRYQILRQRLFRAMTEDMA